MLFYGSAKLLRAEASEKPAIPKVKTDLVILEPIG
jgi:hypothetical protein